MAATPVLALITDEVSQEIGEAVDFCATHGITQVDIRAVDGRNVILFDDRELAALADRLKAAGLTVGCYCSPLLKWPKPGVAVPDGANFHGFDPNAMSAEAATARAFEVADALDAGQVRIFSYLAYHGFAPRDLDPDLDDLLDRAERLGVDLVLENEHVCNVATLADIAAIAAQHPHPRLKAAIDVTNQVYAGHPPPNEDELRAVARLAGCVHVKDIDAGGTYVPVSQGVVDHAGALATILENAPDGPLPIVLETHMPHDGPNASAASLPAIRAMMGG